MKRVRLHNVILLINLVNKSLRIDLWYLIKVKIVSQWLWVKLWQISLIISIHLPQQISEGFYKINLSAHCPMFLNNLWCMVICTVHAAVQLFFLIAFHCSRRSICKKCHNGEKNKLIIRVVRNLKIYTTVCSAVHTVTNLSHNPIVENVSYLL